MCIRDRSVDAPFQSLHHSYWNSLPTDIQSSPSLHACFPSTAKTFRFRQHSFNDFRKNKLIKCRAVCKASQDHSFICLKQNFPVRWIIIQLTRYILIKVGELLAYRLKIGDGGMQCHTCPLPPLLWVWPLLSDRNSRVIWDRTCHPAEVTFLLLSQPTSSLILELATAKGRTRLIWPIWLAYTYRGGIPTVTHPSTNRARCGVTWVGWCAGAWWLVGWWDAGRRGSLRDSHVTITWSRCLTTAWLSLSCGLTRPSHKQTSLTISPASSLHSLLVTSPPPLLGGPRIIAMSMSVCPTLNAIWQFWQNLLF